MKAMRRLLLLLVTVILSTATALIPVRSILPILPILPSGRRPLSLLVVVSPVMLMETG
jgi:hypothetical protein